MNRRVALCAVVMSLVVGCTPYFGKKPEKTETVSQKTEISTPAVIEQKQELPQKKSNLTLIDTLNKGNEIALTENDFSVEVKTKSGKTASGTVKSDAGTTVVQYRIQVAAASSSDKLKEDKKKLEKQLKVTLSIIQEAAYFKLYAGEFDKKNDADTMLQRIKKLGYKDAWIATAKGSSKK